MNKKLESIIISLSFILTLFIFMICNIISKDNEISYAERRKLLQLPKLKIEKLLNGEYFEDIEEYLLDQFVFRDEFRKIKSFINLNVFNQKDNNDIYTVDGGIYKLEYPLNEKSIYNAANIYNKISSTYFKNSNIYYTIVPDKNYFVDEGYLTLDYDKLIDIMKANTKNMDYIDIIKNLKISSYYKTDLHWNQENILDVADTILSDMGNDKKSSDYDVNSFYPFYGSYYGQSASNINPDTLNYLSNEIINQAKVYDFETKKYIKVYEDENFNNIDSYDVFLGGPKSLLQIENLNNKSTKELYVFRDSFGSSLIPLLINEYSKIVVIDLRYISSSELEKYIDPKDGSDVLFMYNTLILNSSDIISK